MRLPPPASYPILLNPNKNDPKKDTEGIPKNQTKASETKGKQKKAAS